MNDAIAAAEAETAALVSLGTIFWTFLTAGAISFGGGVVAYLREYTVSDTKWLDDEAFLDALEIS
ncbi:MAG: chromate transporter, partial [Candidatus Binataceae bacterium]